MRFTQVYFFMLLMVGVSSCVVDEADLSKYLSSGIENVEEAHDVDVIYTDSSYKLFNLKAPLLRRVFTKYAINEEFPKGIEVTFFDKSGHARSWLTAETALRDQSTRQIIVQKNVVLRNDRGERLNGPELIWDEKTKEIYTDRFVKITQADGSVIYSYGFKTNEAFTRRELNAVSGDLHLEEEHHADTLATTRPAAKVPQKPADKRKLN